MLQEGRYCKNVPGRELGNKCCATCTYQSAHVLLWRWSYWAVHVDLMVSGPGCRYYADIRQTISASDQEMNSALAELSRVSGCSLRSQRSGPQARVQPACSVFQNYSGELNYLVALHELYKYINKYYDQVCLSRWCAWRAYSTRLCLHRTGRASL